MEKLVQLGKTLVVLLPHPEAWYAATGETEVSGTGRNAKTTEIVGRAGIEDAFFFPIKLVEAAGERIQLIGSEPFASFWRDQADKFFYVTYMQEAVGEAAAVIQGTDYAVSSIERVEKGLVLLLPALTIEEALPPGELYDVDGDEKREIEAEEAERAAQERSLLDALFDLIAAMQAGSGDFSLPEWTSNVLLPGERECLDDLARKEKRLSKLSSEVASAQAGLAELRERKQLFAGTGRSLEIMARQAFEAMGCEVSDGPPGQADLIVKRNNRVAVVEVKGKGKSAAKADASQLEGWVSDYELENGIQPKGILIVNAWKDKPLPARKAVDFPAQMLSYSERRDHCLITGLQLLGIMLRAEAKPRSKKKLFDSIFDCVGAFGEFSEWTKFLEQRDTTQQAIDTQDGA